MWQLICKLLLKLAGWKPTNGVIPHKKAIIIGVPHTSGWDFVYSYLYYTSVGGVAHIMIKKEFFFWPLGPVLKKMGGIPIDRTRGATITKQIIKEMNSREQMHLALTPRGLALPAGAGNDRAHVYLVDPRGNVMMRWPAGADRKRMLGDMQRLLKASQIG